MKFSVFVICIEAIIYLLLYDLHNCTFKFIYNIIFWRICVRQAYIMVIFASGAEVSFPAGTKYIERRTYATTIPAREEVNLPITTKYGNIRNTQT